MTVSQIFSAVGSHKKDEIFMTAPNQKHSPCGLPAFPFPERADRHIQAFHFQEGLTSEPGSHGDEQIQRFPLAHCG